MGGGSKQPAVTTQIQKVELPAWVERASQSNYDLAQRIADKPYQAYEGQTVAGTTQTTRDAWDYILNNLNAGQGDYDASRGAIAQATGLFNKASGGINSLNRSDYENPYINDVVNAALGDLDKSRTQALMANADAATAAKAFGGDRHAVVDAITNSETAQKAGTLSAGLRADAFNQATSTMQGDLDRMLASGQGILSTGDRYKALGDAAVTNRDTNYKNMLGVGAQQQEQAQRGLDDAYSRWSDRQNYDTERLNLLLASLGMSPYGKTTTGTTTQQGGSSGGTNWGQVAGGVGSLLGAIIMSDRDEKTDIKKLGDDPTTGVPLYAYRYKGDPKSYPKVVGPMAQDLEKAFPGSTRRVNGTLTVDRSKISGVLAGV